MQTLVSPGVEVEVIDESFYNSAGPGTIPLVVIATASNKVSPSGVGFAPFTNPVHAGKLYLATSQRDLIQNFGVPLFHSQSGHALHGYETNEFGLWTAYSYLGLASQCYVLRADLDLSQLNAANTPPVGPPNPGQYWFDLHTTRLGVFRANGNATPGLAWGTAPSGRATPLAVKDANANYDTDTNAPAASFGANGDVAIVTDPDLLYGSSNFLFEKLGGQWYNINSSDWVAAHGTAVTVTRNANATYPDGSVAGSLWVKGNPANLGAHWAVWYYNSSIASWVSLSTPFYQFDSTLIDGNTAKDTAANAAIPVASRAVGIVYVGFDPATGVQEIRRWAGSAWQSLSYIASQTPPYTPPAAGTLWFDPNLQVDIMYGDGSKWLGYRNGGVAGAYATTDPDGPQIAGSAPLTQSDATALVDGDLWIDSSDLENYPAIYRWDGANLKWLLMDNTDQTTPFGIVFSDARADSGPTFPGITYTAESVDPSDLVMSDYIDPDAPDAREYPAGMLLFNMRYSSLNVKTWSPNYFEPGGFDPNTDYTMTSYGTSDEFDPVADPGRWVTTIATQANGAPYMGRKSQRIHVVTALQAVVNANQDIRSEVVFFNLMLAPGYPELIDELSNLNTDMKHTAFNIADTPIRLPPNGTAIQTWAQNATTVTFASGDTATGVDQNGEDGLVTGDRYTGIYYPWGMSSNLDGSEIMIPPSAIALATIAYNDQVAYPWYAPAGFNRGLVTNATSVGYLSSEGEFIPTILNHGQRDVLYVNRINPIAYLPNRGLTVFGQKTLSPVASALDRINVARLCNYIAYHLDNLLKPFLFEPNVAVTRATAKSTCERFFNRLVGLNGVYDFAVVCDLTNNTPDRIDANELWIDCAIQPVKAIEFIYVPVRILSTQASISAPNASVA